MIKIFYVRPDDSPLADPVSSILKRVRLELLQRSNVREVAAPQEANVLLLEEKGSFKDFRYIEKIKEDPLISRCLDKVFTINTDDCATGLLRGLYTSLPKSRFDSRIHAAIPFVNYPNELVFLNRMDWIYPGYRAAWRGNVKSNLLRPKLMATLGAEPSVCLQATTSWLDHHLAEKETYVELILNAKFSLCPAGWAPVSYRIYESMALARCPVILADEFVPPLGPDWNDFALFYPQRDIHGLLKFLQKHEGDYKELGANAQAAWQTFFAADKIDGYIADHLMRLIKHAPLTTKSLELKRWNSVKLQWSNHWTLPQRVLNRARRWSRENTKK